MLILLLSINLIKYLLVIFVFQLYSYFNWSILLFQLSAQAAQHEAIQRQMEMERERYGPLPPH